MQNLEQHYPPELPEYFKDSENKNSVVIETDRRELAIIQFETQRNDAMDKYFAARPQLFRTREKECLFEAGFRMAWEFLEKEST